MSAYGDRIAETERLKERKRARVERGAGGVLGRTQTEEQMSDRHAVEHEENIMRDVTIGKRGSIGDIK